MKINLTILVRSLASHPTKILTNDSHPTKILKRNINVNRGFGFSAFVAVGWVDEKTARLDQTNMTCPLLAEKRCMDGDMLISLK